jgi:hypothetical protein
MRQHHRQQDARSDVKVLELPLKFAPILSDLVLKFNEQLNTYKYRSVCLFLSFGFEDEIFVELIEDLTNG